MRRCSWDSSRLDASLARSNLDFLDEIVYILGRFGHNERRRYLTATRSGRGRSPQVPRPLRVRLLNEVIKPYEARKSARGTMDWNDIALEAAGAPTQSYDIVVVDETQDLSANQIRAVMAHLDADHVTTFIIDAMQRIYPQGFFWRELQIEMRPDMVYSLSRNHRNTIQIASLARTFVNDLPTDDDAMLPNDDSCIESGTMPKVVVGKYSAQIGFMLDCMQGNMARNETVAVLQPRGGGWFNHIRRELRRRNIDYCELQQEREWPTGSELVALSTFHSAKGLEFDHVLIPGLSAEVTQHGDGEDHGSLDSPRRLVAMGVGRARKSVMLGYKAGEESSVFRYVDPMAYELVEV